MKEFLRRLAFLYFAGGVGALFRCLGEWLLGAAGVTASMGVRLAPPLEPHWLLESLVSGGLWALLLVAFFHDPAGRFMGLAAAIGVVRAGFLLFLVWPSPTALGLVAPLFVLGYHLIWALVAGGVTLALRAR